MLYTIQDCIDRLATPLGIGELPAPSYTPGEEHSVERVALAVESMSRHTSNEGWELMLGLEGTGYTLQGYGLGGKDGRPYHASETDITEILRYWSPGTVVVQDKREWDGLTAGNKGYDPRERFTNVGALRNRSDIFKLTVLKDAHSNPLYHRASAEEMGCHGWIVYYSPRVVKHLAPFVREQHLVRTYHSVNPSDVPSYRAEGRRDCLLSGAVSGAYPLRKRLVRDLRILNGQVKVDYTPHPGYHRKGSQTPAYLKTLSGYKVSICTASRYGYVLRRIVESSACGCRVLTDLPVDEVLPEIDGNLVRIHPNISTGEIAQLCKEIAEEYDPERQAQVATVTQQFYSYREIGRRLAEDIERLRKGYTTY